MTLSNRLRPPGHAFWHLREVSPENTEPLSDLEQMSSGVTNQQLAENGVSFDLGVLDTSGPWNSGVFSHVRYDPHTATCALASRPPLMGR